MIWAVRRSSRKSARCLLLTRDLPKGVTAENGIVQGGAAKAKSRAFSAQPLNELLVFEGVVSAL